MKEYLQKFRSEALGGTLALFKRTFLPAIILNCLVGIIMVMFGILILSAIGLSFMDMLTSGNALFEPKTVAGYEATNNGLAGTLMTFLFLFGLISFFVVSWVYYMYLKLNDNEIRENNNSPVYALSRSFSARIFSIMGFIFLMSLLSFGVMMVYGLVGLAFAFIPFAGTIILFAGYAVVCIFLLRFILGLPAIVHGQMAVMDAFRYSYAHMTWKRSGKIFLVGFVCYVILLLMMVGIFYAFNGSVTDSIRSNSIPGLPFIIVSVLVGIVVYAALLAFGFSALSTLYFRYSNDSRDEATDVQEHLVGDFS